MAQVRIRKASIHTPAAAPATNARVRIYKAGLHGDRNLKVRVYRAYLSGPVPAGHVRIYKAGLVLEDVNTAPVYVSTSAGQWVALKVFIPNGAAWKEIV